MPMAQHSSHMKNSTAAAWSLGKWRKCGANAACISIWRQFTSSVIPAISTALGGAVHTSSAANSEPPAKLRLVISPSSSTLSPFWVACAPSSMAKGMMPITIGRHARTPRQRSAQGDGPASRTPPVATLLIRDTLTASLQTDSPRLTALAAEIQLTGALPQACRPICHSGIRTRTAGGSGAAWLLRTAGTSR